MSPIKHLPAAALAIALLSGCMTATPPAQVTRFHTIEANNIAYGSVAIEMTGVNGDSQSLEQASYSAAVLRELQRLGFTEYRGKDGGSDYVARVRVDQSRLGAVGGRSPISVGVGGNTGGYRSGVGLGIGFNLGGKPKDKIATELSVRIAKRESETALWEGRSLLEVKENSPAAQPGLASAKLAETLFRDFPGQSGTTISVK